jgi:hypothetical protein
MGLNMKKFIIKDSPNTYTSISEDDVDYSIPSHSDLTQVCEAFTLFLKACGYNLDNQYVTIDHHDDLK